VEVVGNEEEKMFTILVNQEALLVYLYRVTDTAGNRGKVQKTED